MILYFLKAFLAHFRRARSLFFLTAFGVALGVASVLAIQIINLNAIGAFSAGIQAISGEADPFTAPASVTDEFARWCHTWNAFAKYGVGLGQSTTYDSPWWIWFEAFDVPAACAPVVSIAAPVDGATFTLDEVAAGGDSELAECPSD